MGSRAQPNSSIDISIISLFFFFFFLAQIQLTLLIRQEIVVKNDQSLPIRSEKERIKENSQGIMSVW
jgi:hypothetical protein